MPAPGQCQAQDKPPSSRLHGQCTFTPSFFEEEEKGWGMATPTPNYSKRLTILIQPLESLRPVNN